MMKKEYNSNLIDFLTAGEDLQQRANEVIKSINEIKAENRRCAILSAARAYNSSCHAEVAADWMIAVAKQFEIYMNELNSEINNET